MNRTTDFFRNYLQKISSTCQHHIYSSSPARMVNRSLQLIFSWIHTTNFLKQPLSLSVKITQRPLPNFPYSAETRKVMFTKIFSQKINTEKPKQDRGFHSRMEPFQEESRQPTQKTKRATQTLQQSIFLDPLKRLKQ